MTPELILASASPRRRALLEEAGVPFRVRVAAVDEESVNGPDPAGVALGRARLKARAVAATLPADGVRRCVLGADTVVALPGGTLLGTPTDAAEGESHLRALSGTTHSVWTGVCLVDLPGGGEEGWAEESRVTMRPLRAEEIADYVAGGEGRDKAGGYAIQEGGDRFIVGLRGSRTNVVGLPMESTLERLRRRGVR